ESPRAGSGNAIVHGQLSTRNGTPVAVTSQEWVIYSNIRRLYCGRQQASSDVEWA
ncbi:hypothetical protein GYMLUDRAFT_155774, partial [Collybiopsis luxurians FD-317 M1]